ncbi:MAG: NAD(P)-binding protein [Candidatus Latescibacteria bacterium]|nr:NAD(P)-binding protein [Candidatus Latescibacterota bacterium]
MRDVQTGLPDRICGDFVKMINLTINNQPVSVSDGSKVLDAAKMVGITIPTLCHSNGYKPNTSCMICVVHELKTDSLILACSMPAEDGMHIETDNERVREARKDTLDLLLSEHVGDCEAPCERTCPSNMNIPLMIRQVKDKNLEEAIITVKADIPLPAVLSRICPAPCERGCNRKYYDNPVSICKLIRFVADVDLAKKSPYRPDIRPKSEKKVAVIGAGPTGLSAAYYMSQSGHDCVIYDQNINPGGLLQYGVPDEKLPKPVLDAEIEQILKLGIELKLEQTLGKDFNLSELTDEYNAVVLAFGKTDINVLKNSKIELSPRGIAINKKTFETTIPGVFTGGNAISEGKMAIRSVAHGKFIAYSVNQFVNGLTVTGYPQRFNSVIGKLHNDEMQEFLKEAEAFNQIIPAESPETGYSYVEAVKESKRCFHCDCRKPDSCKLRQYAEEYGANHKRFKFGQRKRFQKIIQHDLITFEPGKCIKCNLCIEITKKAGERFGLTFINRGFDVQLVVPFNESLKKGLQKAAKKCVDACPTAAIAWRNAEEGLDRDSK